MKHITRPKTCYSIYRGSREFTGKHSFQSLFNKVEALFIRKRLRHKCFPVNSAKLFYAHILKNNLFFRHITIKETVFDLIKTEF